MSKELIERLRHIYADGDPITEEAADCIEQLFGNSEQLRAQLKEAQKELENERARSIHSCGPNCQRPTCVNRRLTEQLAASQANEQQLREALENHSGNYKLSKEECKRINSLLDSPSDTTALEAMIQKAVKESNDRLYEERELWDRMFGDGAKKLERLELELDDCLYVLEALWDKKQDKSVTQKWADILIRNKRATGASSAEDTCHPTTE